MLGKMTVVPEEVQLFICESLSHLEELDNPLAPDEEKVTRLLLEEVEQLRKYFPVLTIRADDRQSIAHIARLLSDEYILSKEEAQEFEECLTSPFIKIRADKTTVERILRKHLVGPVLIDNKLII